MTLGLPGQFSIQHTLCFDLGLFLNIRFSAANHLPPPWSPLIRGSVDVIAIQIPRLHPQSLFYNGKYKAHVAKFQVFVDCTGCPIWYSGPHYGVLHDVRIFKQMHPHFVGPEKYLGDLAYVGKYPVHLMRHLVTGLCWFFSSLFHIQLTTAISKGVKRVSKHIPLPHWAMIYNKHLRKWRSRVEHFFGKMRTFNIIKLSRHQNLRHLRNAFHILIHLYSMFYREFKTLNPIQ